MAGAGRAVDRASAPPPTPSLASPRLICPLRALSSWPFGQRGRRFLEAPPRHTHTLALAHPAPAGRARASEANPAAQWDPQGPEPEGPGSPRPLPLAVPSAPLADPLVRWGAGGSGGSE